jgi:Transposase (partial DDE domain)
LTKHGPTGPPQIKEQSKQGTLPGEQAPKKAKIVLSAGKVMATVFWDSQDVIYFDYLEKGKRITGLYCAKLLGRFDAELLKKRPHLAKKKVLFIMKMHGLHLLSCQGQIGRIGQKTATPSTVFSRFGPVRLLFVSKLEKFIRQAEI